MKGKELFASFLEIVNRDLDSKIFKVKGVKNGSKLGEDIHQEYKLKADGKNRLRDVLLNELVTYLTSEEHITSFEKIDDYYRYSICFANRLSDEFIYKIDAYLENNHLRKIVNHIHFIRVFAEDNVGPCGEATEIIEISGLM